jgi:hypothetical protein
MEDCFVNQSLSRQRIIEIFSDYLNENNIQHEHRPYLIIVDLGEHYIEKADVTIADFCGNSKNVNDKVINSIKHLYLSIVEASLRPSVDAISETMPFFWKNEDHKERIFLNEYMNRQLKLKDIVNSIEEIKKVFSEKKRKREEKDKKSKK